MSCKSAEDRKRATHLVVVPAVPDCAETEDTARRTIEKRESILLQGKTVRLLRRENRERAEKYTVGKRKGHETLVATNAKPFMQF